MSGPPHVLFVHAFFFSPRGPEHLHDIREGFSEKTMTALLARYPEHRLLVLLNDAKFDAELTGRGVDFMRWDNTNVLNSMAKLVEIMRTFGVVVTLPPGRNISYMRIGEHVTHGSIVWVGRHDHEVHGIAVDKELTVAEMQLARASTARW